MKRRGDYEKNIICLYDESKDNGHVRLCRFVGYEISCDMDDNHDYIYIDQKEYYYDGDMNLPITGSDGGLCNKWMCDYCNKEHYFTDK